jgi:hypothetical protein
MEISDEKVEKYREVYKEIYGQPIEKGRARDELTALVCLMNAVRNYVGNMNPADISDEKNNTASRI